MVQNADAEELSSLTQAFRQFDVFYAWRRISARMVVRQDDRLGVPRNRGLEDLAWLCCGHSYVA